MAVTEVQQYHYLYLCKYIQRRNLCKYIDLCFANKKFSRFVVFKIVFNFVNRGVLTVIIIFSMISFSSSSVYD